MQKQRNEIRDPIHVFIVVDNDERKVVDSRPFQRLRHIHQLALTNLVYPGATHKRFEHALGVMELAGRVYDVVTRDDCVTDAVRRELPQIAHGDQKAYWRRVIRMAALCHDIGHLPFSHSAEHLLPDGWDHEKITRKIIESSEMEALWRSMTPPLRSEDIVKLAVGKKKAPDLKFTNWEEILSEIIIGDAFGVDRMDYLLRDSHHAGVAYGRFDHFRLVDTLRILTPQDGNESPTGWTSRVALGVEEGGLQSAEALLLARYMMYSQVYFHPIRRIYDVHLADFLTEWLPDGRFSTSLDEHLRMTDIEVFAAIRAAADSAKRKGHAHARLIQERRHFKVLWQRNPQDLETNPEAGLQIYEEAARELSAEHVRRNRYPGKRGDLGFPVLQRDARVCSSTSASEVLRTIPVVAVDFVFVSREKYADAKRWLEANRGKIIQRPGE